MSHPLRRDKCVFRAGAKAPLRAAAYKILSVSVAQRRRNNKVSAVYARVRMCRHAPLELAKVCGGGCNNTRNVEKRKGESCSRADISSARAACCSICVLRVPSLDGCVSVWVGDERGGIVSIVIGGKVGEFLL